jgi:hypothetical protein
VLLVKAQCHLKQVVQQLSIISIKDNYFLSYEKLTECHSNSGAEVLRDWRHDPERSGPAMPQEQVGDRSKTKEYRP